MPFGLDHIHPSCRNPKWHNPFNPEYVSIEDNEMLCSPLTCLPTTCNAASGDCFYILEALVVTLLGAGIKSSQTVR